MSISSKAILVVLSVSGIPDFRRQDKKVSDEVARKHKSKRELGVYNKHLIDPKAPTYEALKQWAWKVRDWHYDRTVPYAHNGARFLKATEILKYTAGLTELREEGEDLFGAFIADYPRLKQKARRELNGLYDESEYPSVAKLRSKFLVDHTFLPVPDSGHVVLDLVTEEVTKQVQESTEVAVKNALAEAMREPWVRLHEVVQNMAAALKVPDQRFHDTLVSNVAEVCDLMPGLNITDDPALNAMAKDVRKSLTKSKPDTLREDKDRRKEVAEKAAALAAKMMGFVQ
jgi:hypothetical protein